MKTIDSKILVKEINKNEELVEKMGNFVIPGSTDYDEVEVVSVGEKVEGVKTGDRILTYHGAGHSFRRDNTDYRVISIPDVLVIL